MRWLAFVHRWLGVGLCLLFFAWFTTGIVMIYKPFPSLSDTQRIARSTPFDGHTTLAPLTTLLPKREGVFKATLVNVLGEPYLWWVSPGQDKIKVVHGKTGTAARFDEASVHRIALGFGPNKKISAIEGNIEYDQWIVHHRFDPFRPFYRIDYDDQDRTSIYISSRNAQVMQRTTGSQRAWNYVGAVVHWIYPTIIRKNWVLWDQLVWWLALIGIIGAVTGLTLGIVRSWRAKAAWSPFKGWLHWHHLVGLVIGIFVLSWIFSGWLSMDHGRLFSEPDPTADQLVNYHGQALGTSFHDSPDLAAIIASGASEIELRVINGTPLLISKSPSGSRITWLLETGNSWRARAEGLPPELISGALRSTWKGASFRGLSELAHDDVYANLREGQLAPSVLRAVIQDPAEIWVHVDRNSGEIISVMDPSRRVYRWLYNGLHSLDIPVLTSRPALWESVILCLLGVGALFSLTGVVLGMRRLLR